MHRVLAGALATLAAAATSWAATCTAPSAGGPTLDLTTAGASGSVNGAIFTQVAAQPTGTGVIDSFVRINPGGSDPCGQGYNTGGRPLQFDENNSPTFTRNLDLTTLGVFASNGTEYVAFLLDINQSSAGSNGFLSLDSLQIFQSPNPDALGYPSALGAKVYDLDAGADNWVKMNASLNNGSGSGDVLVYVPVSAFDLGDSANRYVYLYSRFGEEFHTNGGFEEWAALLAAAGDNGGGGIQFTPEPSIYLLFGTGLLGMGLWGRRRARS